MIKKPRVIHKKTGGSHLIAYPCGCATSGRRSIRLRKTSRIIPILATWIAASGCIWVSDPEKPGFPKEEEVILRFKVSAAVNSTGLDLTRSDSEGHPEGNNGLPLIEDMINVNDVAFFIFAGNGEDAPLLTAVTDIAASTDPNISISGGIGIYDVAVVIKKETIERYLRHDLSPDHTTPVCFKLVVLANTTARRHTTSNFSTLPTITIASSESEHPATFSHFMAEANELTFDIAADFYHRGESTASIDGTIPMFGIRSFFVPESVIYRSRPDDRIYLGEINLLRAVAKVRVVDAIRKSDVGYPRISEMHFTYASSWGALLPKDAATYEDGYQVHQVNIPEQTHDHNFEVPFLKLHQDNPGTSTAGSAQWVVYVPEQIITKGSVPIVTIKVQQAENSESQTFRIPLGGYNDVAFHWAGSEGYLIRNHTYELRVSWSPGGKPMLQYIVCPWRDYDAVDVPVFS